MTIDGGHEPGQNPPRISVVLPVYNGQRYIGEAVESVLAQTFRDWELIIVDDASTDETPKLLERYARIDDRIQVHRNATNRKLPASINVGFALARGVYFTWTSDDNRYHPHAFAAMVKVLDDNPTTGLVYASCNLIDMNGRKTGVWRAKSARWIYSHNVVKACFLYRATLSAQIGGYDEDLFLMEDWEYWLRAARKTSFHRLRERLYDYRFHGGSLTATRLNDIVRAQLRMLGKALAETPGVSRRAYACSRLFLAMGAYRIGDPAEARRQLDMVRPVSPLAHLLVRGVFAAYRFKKRLRGQP